jgi:hypothetical protein
MPQVQHVDVSGEICYAALTQITDRGLATFGRMPSFD